MKHHLLASPHLDSTIPIAVHSDGGEIFASTEYSIYSWSSALVSDINTFDYRFLICLLPEDLKIKWSSDHEIIDFILWNIRVLEDGIHPSHDHLGRVLTGHRAAKAGKPLATGWRCTLTATLSDNKEKVSSALCIFTHTFHCRVRGHGTSRFHDSSNFATANRSLS
jgi:hypothetical protein